MPLNPVQLQSDLLRHFRRPPRTALKTATRLADIYYSYAQGATAPPSFPVLNDALKGLMTATLRATLFAAIANPQAGNPATFATAWSTGLITFWTAPPVVFQAPEFPAPPVQVGVPVPSPTMAVTLQQCLVALVSVPNAAETAASMMASCLDAATRQFAVLLFPPGTGPPIPLI